MPNTTIEHALDPVYASNIGVNIDDLYISQPDSGEQALEIADSLIRSGAMDMIVVDSVAALVPKAEAEGAMGDAHMALQARLMSQALRKLTGSLAKSNCLIIFINQIRQKVGILFGNPEVTPGGNALKFYSSIRMDIRRKTAIKKGDEVVGYETTVKVVKNKLAPPFRVASFDMMFGTGISHVGEVLDLALKEGLMEQSGAWISRNGENIAQGRAKAKAYLEENPEVCDELEKELRAKWKEEREATSTADMAAANNVAAWSSASPVKEEENTVSEDVESDALLVCSEQMIEWRSPNSLCSCCSQSCHSQKPAPCRIDVVCLWICGMLYYGQNERTSPRLVYHTAHFVSGFHVSRALCICRCVHVGSDLLPDCILLHTKI